MWPQTERRTDRKTDNMTSIGFRKFLVFLLLHQVYCEEPEPVFRAKGTIIEMGYCFGVDYIVVYRCAPEEDQLLGNSSTDSVPVTPPADLQGRILINQNQHLLGLQISHLTHEDSGIYRRECWQNQTLVSKHTQRLSVCDEEVEAKEIIVKEEDGGAELLCNNTSIGSGGTSVRWYHETHPLYKPTLFLDSSVSLEPLVEELQGAVEVRVSGALLLLSQSMLKNNQQFYCLVSKGKSCLSFQNMHLPDHSESRDIFASQGDGVVLKCPSDGDNQHWETPMGRINGSSVNMYISSVGKSEDFSLVITAFTDGHSGDYSCISSSLEVQYLLVLCPKKKSQEKVVVEGRDVLLDCDVGEDDSQRVQWFRQEPSGGHELVHDSNDKTVPLPEDLKGRLTLSENSSMLMISHLEVKDQGVYWCVVLGGPKLLEEDDDYTDYYYEEDTGEDQFSDGDYWEDTHKCIFKQETTVILIKKIGAVDSEPVNVKPAISNHDTSPTSDPPAAANVTAYAVGAGLVGLLVVGVIVAVIVTKRRAKSSPKQREAASGLKDLDSACTERLTHNDRSDA